MNSLEEGPFSINWKDDQVFEYIEYTLAWPGYADEFRKFANKAVMDSVGATREPPLMMDTSEAENMLRTLTLVNGIYPMAVVAAAIMGGLFPGLIVMQSDREASIMRVLGTSKKRARAMLVLEQLLLCLSGAFCAAALLLLINGVSIVDRAAPLGVYAAAHLAACVAGGAICAVIVTRRKPLELLQVKE